MDNQLTIVYIQWLKKKTIILDTTSDKYIIKMEKVVGNGGGTYFSIIIFQSKREFFKVSSNNGFDDFVFKEFGANLIEHSKKG